MILDRVTFTGADNSISPAALIALHHSFPFIEWGILVGSSSGNSRFPDKEWISQLKEAILLIAPEARPALSIHICGSLMRSLAVGDINPFMEFCGELMPHTGRIQLNFHRQAVADPVLLYKSLVEIDRSTIFQLDGAGGREMLLEVLKLHGTAGQTPGRRIDLTPLHDASGGTGLVPDPWPKPLEGFLYQGWAGGLGPHNIDEEIIHISDVARCASCWIDMETHVRSERGGAGDRLDIGKIESVCQQVGPMVNMKIGRTTFRNMLDWIKSAGSSRIGADPVSVVSQMVAALDRSSSDLKRIVAIAKRAGVGEVHELESALEHVEELVRMNGRQEEQIALLSGSVEERTRNLNALVLVYDATVALLTAVNGVEAITEGQVMAAVTAHREIMGEDSMVHLPLRRKSEGQALAGVG